MLKKCNYCGKDLVLSQGEPFTILRFNESPDNNDKHSYGMNEVFYHEGCISNAITVVKATMTTSEITLNEI